LPFYPARLPLALVSAHKIFINNFIQWLDFDVGKSPSASAIFLEVENAKGIVEEFNTRSDSVQTSRLASTML